MDFSHEFLDEVSDYKKLYYWIRNILEQNEISLDKNYLLIFDIIGVTGKLHCIREIASADSTGIVSLLHTEIIQNLNFILQLAKNLSEALPTTRMEFMGHKGDRIDLVGDAASLVLLSLLAKYTHVGKDTRIMMLEEGSDWEYRNEIIGNYSIHNIILNHKNLNQMPTKDPLSSSYSILFSPSVNNIIRVLQAFSIINEQNMPNPALSRLIDTVKKVELSSEIEASVKEVSTVIVRAGPDKEIATEYLLRAHTNYTLDFDSGRKNLGWITLNDEVDSILESAFKTYRKFPHSQIFITRNLAMISQLINGASLCIDPFATNILSKLLKMHTFSPGIRIFNPKSPTVGFTRESIENHVGIEEFYDTYEANEM